jgi:hypothetical protein
LYCSNDEQREVVLELGNTLDAEPQACPEASARRFWSRNLPAAGNWESSHRLGRAKPGQPLLLDLPTRLSAS